jgi:hypothetical protein
MISILKPASVLCGARKSAFRISSQSQRRKAAFTGGIQKSGSLEMCTTVMRATKLAFQTIIVHTQTGGKK